MEIYVSQSTTGIPVTIIRAEGVFDANSVEQFMEPTQSAIDNGAQNLLLDLTKISFMSSIGIRIINAIYYQLHPRQSDEHSKEISMQIKKGTYQAPHLRILSPADNVCKVLKMAGVDRYIAIYDQEEDALAAFSE